VPDPRDIGHEPDPRFSLANERTFLAWIRTSLALVAGGLGVVQLLPPFGLPFAREVLGAALLVLGGLVSATSYRRWAATERALRTDAPLPPSPVPRLLGAGVATVAAGALVVLVVSRT